MIFNHQLRTAMVAANWRGCEGAMEERRAIRSGARARKYDIKMNDLDRMRECAERIRDWVGASLRQEGVFLGGPKGMTVALVVAEAIVNIFDALNPPRPPGNVIDFRPAGGRRTLPTPGR